MAHFGAHDRRHVAVVAGEAAGHGDPGQDALRHPGEGAVAGGRRREHGRWARSDEGMLGHLERAYDDRLRVVVSARFG